MEPLHQLEQRLGYQFKDQQLLRAALYHSSYANEHRTMGISSNERLEFLGDAVLGFVSADFLYRKHPDLPEGELTRIRAALVCERTLSVIARSLDLGRYLLMGHGEEQTGGREKPSILADAMEAVLAAVYVDGGYEAARGVIRVLFQEEERLTAWRGQDDKSALQEYTQANGLDLPAYEIVAQSGPDHDRRFTAQVSVQGRAVATGEGNSKKAAEQAAAKAALKACRGEA